jgi:hypothetical protein
MTIGLAYWVIFLLWIILSLYFGRADIQGGKWEPLGLNLILIVLLFLLGWGVFGFIVRG